MKRLAIVTLVLGLLAAAPAAAEPSDGDLRLTVETMLGGLESTSTNEQWAALGDGAVPHLLAILGDEGQKRSTRARAVAALGNFPTPEVVTALNALLEPDGDKVLQRKALHALARTGGVDQLDRIQAFLASDDTTLRQAAVHALAVIKTDAARAALEAHRAVESSTAVTKAIDEELARW